MPSSPSGTVQQREDDGAAVALVITSAGAMLEPVGSSRPGNASGPEARAARASSAIAQSPSREMPTGVIRYFAGSAARNTCAAVVQLTSCSADCPPNNTTKLIRSPVAMSPRRYRVRRCDSGQAMSRQRQVDDWSAPTSRSTASRSIRARCVPASCSCRSSLTATGTTSSTPHSPPAPRPTSPHVPATVGSAIEVSDTLQALMDLATDRRGSFGGTVIGITGSVGKTSTKDLAWAAFADLPAHGGERAQLQQRARPADHDPQRARRHRGDGVGDGHPRPRRDRAVCAESPHRTSASSPASPRRTATASAASTVSPGPRRSSSPRCPPTV